MTEHPNLLFILTDQWPSHYFGHRGYAIETPSLDRLAARGTVFTNAFTTCPLCSPARGALLTGKWHHHNGVLDNVNVGYSIQEGLAAEQRTWLEAGIDAGYHVGYFGKWHLGPNNPMSRGVHRHDGPVESGSKPYDPATSDHSYQQKAEQAQQQAARQLDCGRPLFWGVSKTSKDQSRPMRTAARAVEFLREYGSAGRPFFLAASFVGPHFPHYLPKDYAERAEALIPKIELPPNLHDPFENKPWHHNTPWWPSMDTSDIDEDEWRRIRAYSHMHCTLVDEAIGRILAALDDAGQADNTAVIFTADHGDTDGAHNRFDKGAYFYEEVWRIPLTISMPGAAPAEQRAFVSLIDVAETLFRLLGDANDRDARDLRHLVGNSEADQATFPDEAFGVYDLYNGISFAVRAVRDERYKYVWNPQTIDELYDLETDPYELTNLAGNDSIAEHEERLRNRLHQWLASVGDDLPSRVRELPEAGTIIATGRPGP